MSILIRNAILLHIDPIAVEAADLRVEGGTIAEVAPGLSPRQHEDILDCGGAVVMAGLVNGHTHLYSALATGMPPPPRAPRDFHEILQLIWWRLDRALDAESIEVSGRIGALDALCCGTTTLIDHHASPNCIAGSLDALERGIAAIGLRGVLCYEVTDRNGGRGEAEAGLAENARYLAKCAARPGHQFGALVGAHAAFTLSDESLKACADLASRQKTGVHIHVAEDPCDDRICRETYGRPLVERLDCSGIISERTLLAHATHLAPADAARLGGRVLGVAHNPRSNMHNQVGYAPVDRMSRVQLGTDGIGSDMFAEARHAWFKARDAKATVSPFDIIKMQAHAARSAGSVLGCTLGLLAAGAAADVVITDYLPSTALDSSTAIGHLLFGLGAQHVKDVLVGGRFALRDRRVVTCDESEARRGAVPVARAMWQRMAPLGE